MNKTLSAAELKAASVINTMSRADKLMYWARLIRNTPHQLMNYNSIEYFNRNDLKDLRHQGTAFALALTDPILRDAGLTGDSVGDCCTFFELSQSDLHEFSCECHGAINNAEMAKRVEGIASNTARVNPPQRSISMFRFFR